MFCILDIVKKQVEKVKYHGVEASTSAAVKGSACEPKHHLCSVARFCIARFLHDINGERPLAKACWTDVVCQLILTF